MLDETISLPREVPARAVLAAAGEVVVARESVSPSDIDTVRRRRFLLSDFLLTDLLVTFLVPEDTVRGRFLLSDCLMTLEFWLLPEVFTFLASEALLESTTESDTATKSGAEVSEYPSWI